MSQPTTQSTLTIRDVPPKEVEAMAKLHKEMGADKIEVIKQPNENFSLKVTYSD
jgi:nanoRNase/pAp phosphatase (c-di-AMP/oligoRNAs hydrolase)